jgi:hypothetical protein
MTTRPATRSTVPGDPHRGAGGGDRTTTAGRVTTPNPQRGTTMTYTLNPANSQRIEDRAGRPGQRAGARPAANAERSRHTKKSPPDRRTIGSKSSVVDHIAHHEAGHAVVARALGLPIVEVAIDPTSGGHNRYRASEPPAGWTATNDGAVLFAGYLAEIRWCVGELHGSDDDRAKAEQLIGEGLDARMAERIASDILDRHGSDVERLADALIRNRRLTGEQIDELLGRAAPDQPNSAADPGHQPRSAEPPRSFAELLDDWQRLTGLSFDDMLRQGEHLAAAKKEARDEHVDVIERLALNLAKARRASDLAYADSRSPWRMRDDLDRWREAYREADEIEQALREALFHDGELFRDIEYQYRIPAKVTMVERIKRIAA